MFCTRCGLCLPDTAHFCTRCGAPVAPVYRQPLPVYPQHPGYYPMPAVQQPPARPVPPMPMPAPAPISAPAPSPEPAPVSVRESISESSLESAGQ